MIRLIPPAVESLARTMCSALEIDPDQKFSHGAGYRVYPRIDRSNVHAATHASLHHSPNWHQFVWEAHKWIFEHSGGELPASLAETGELD